jgi:3-oxoadipate enol-lactonase
MPWLACKSRRIHYEQAGPEDGPACVLVNGLTQYLKLWIPFRDALVARGFCVASYDMLGQGQSDKPRLFIEQHEQVDVLRNLIASLGTRPVFVGGISFGGAIALRYAIEHPGTIAGLVPMSSFAELSPQLTRIGMPSFSAARPTCRTCCFR